MFMLLVMMVVVFSFTFTCCTSFNCCPFSRCLATFANLFVFIIVVYLVLKLVFYIIKLVLETTEFTVFGLTTSTKSSKLNFFFSLYFCRTFDFCDVFNLKKCYL